MPGAFRLGNLAGVDVYVNYSWLIILVLLTVSTAIGWFPAYYPAPWGCREINWVA